KTVQRPPSSRVAGEAPTNGPRTSRPARPGSAGGRTPALQIDSAVAARTPGPGSKPTEADGTAGHFATDSDARQLREVPPGRAPASVRKPRTRPDLWLMDRSPARIWARVGIAAGAVVVLYAGVVLWAVARN